MRSGSPSGATRSSTWKISTAFHGTSSRARWVNIAHGVVPPLTAKVNRPLSATAAPARSFTKRAAREARDAAVVHDHELVFHRYPFFSAWPPNSERIAERILSVKSPLPLDSKRS